MSVPFTAPDGGVLVWVNEEWDGRNFRNVGKNDAASSASPIPSSQLLKPRRGPCWRTPPAPLPSPPTPHRWYRCRVFIAALTAAKLSCELRCYDRANPPPTPPNPPTPLHVCSDAFGPE